MGELVSLIKHKVANLKGDDRLRMIDVCPLCDSLVGACDVDTDKTVRFMCQDVSHDTMVWKQENARPLSTRPRTTGR
jgi:hypothetical protein